jgi:hypothetical protein
MTEYGKLKALIEEIEASGDVAKCYEKGNKAAGTRLRKNMQDIKALAQGVRKEISELKTEK